MTAHPAFTDPGLILEDADRVTVRKMARKATTTFKVQGFWLTVLSVSLLAWTAAYAQITPAGDAYTNSADPTTNFGANVLLDVDGATATTYIQFNLASIPSSATVSHATLKLYVNVVATAGSFNVDYVNGSWTENTITRNLAPAMGSMILKLPRQAAAKQMASTR